MAESVNIGEVIPEGFDCSGFCSSRGYYNFEKRVVAYLKTQGWKFPERKKFQREEESWYGDGENFITTDGDSFSPLVRVLFGATKPDGTEVDIWHG